jgi:2-polyprenyl-3-methyl-5-hydroxy-6-metoxy-1,4-benzoquinol methylase
VDASPKFRLQAASLVWSLIALGGVRGSAIVVHCVGEPPRDFRDLMVRRYGVEVRSIDGAAHPYCNKIQQLDTFAGCDGRVVLLDCDTMVTRPVPWPRDAAVAAKRVDTATPPAAVLRRIFAHAGLTPTWVDSDCLPGRDGRETVSHNYNGGVYVIDGAVVAELRDTWLRWAAECATYGELVDTDWVHLDQVAFALAMTELGLGVDVLDRRFNFPTHLPLAAEHDCDPFVLHYHWMLDDQQLLRRIGLPLVDARIDQVNAALTKDRRAAFDNATFWDYRYASDAERGSGLGSRGPSLALKREVLQRLVDAGAPRTVLDVGCGDLEAARSLEGAFDYLGVDLSVEALALAKAKRPDWSFAAPHMLPDDRTFDLVLCLDVLIHQPSREAYESVIQALCSRTGRTLVVAGYDEAPVFTSSLTFFHEPLSASLRRLGRFAEAFAVARYRDVTIVVATPPPADMHPRDMGADLVRDVVGWTRDPLRFRELLDRSRRQLGFFPAHAPRAVEYSWIAGRVASCPGVDTVVDAGAGVGVLPLHFAAAGYRVVTVDHSPLVRLPAERRSWNEWGFLDYAAIDPRIVSCHEPFETLALRGPADIIYSVSVIEHLATPIRQAWLRRAAALLRPGGHLLLTVDLAAPGEDLWPFAEGRVVEADHGALTDLCREATAAGLTVDSVEVVRALPATRVDVALIAARRPGTPGGPA